MKTVVVVFFAVIAFLGIYVMFASVLFIAVMRAFLRALHL